MWPFIRRCLGFFVNFSLLVLLMPSTRCMMVTEKLESTHPTPSPIKYRVSLPRGEQPSNRVPPHLQDIHADDVIHIIEPPQYFELLKMLVQQRMLPNTGAELGAKKSAASDLVTQHTQHGGLQAGRPRQHGAEEKAALPPPKGGGRLSSPPLLPPNGLPLELVASVRKLERLMQKGRPAIKPHVKQRIQTKKLQTVLMEQGYANQQYERGQQLQQSGVKLRRKERVRRYAKEAKEIPDNRSKRLKKTLKPPSDAEARPGRDQSVDAQKTGRKMGIKVNNNKNNHNLRSLIKLKLQEFVHKEADSTGVTSKVDNENHVTPSVPEPGKLHLPNGYLRRRKREASANETKTATTFTRTSTNTKGDHYQHFFQLKGNELLDHITVLLNKATHYIADPPEMGARTVSSNSTWRNHLAHDWQLGTKPKALIGEIDPLEMRAKEKSLLKQKQVHRILESSINATNAIMEGLMLVKNSTMLKKANNNYNHTAAGAANELLSMRINKRFGDRIRESGKLSVDGSTSGGQNRQKKHRDPPALEVDLLKETSTKSSISSLSLLYTDVMNNIRHMLQAKNLGDLEEELQQRKLHRKRLLEADVDLVLQPPPKVLIEDVTDVTDYGEFRNLNKYLNELQSIVNDFVDPATTELVLNTYEYTSSTAPPHPAPTTTTSSTTTTTTTTKATAASNNWYLINGDGRIYQTHLTAKQRPTVSIFHRFPDIPNAELHLRNRTQLATTTQKKI